MSKAQSAELELTDHRELVDWVTISKSHGSDRRIHRIDESIDTGSLSNGDEVEVACGTTLLGAESIWRAKPAGVFPVGYHPLCDCPECFGE